MTFSTISRWSLVLCVAVVLLPTVSAAEEIAVDTVWSQNRSITTHITINGSTLRVEPGVVLSFAKGGRITLGRGAALLAKGTKEKPIVLQGTQTGLIDGYGASLLLQHCRLEGLGAASDNGRQHSINISAASDRSIKILDTEIHACASLNLKPTSGAVEVSRCNITANEKATPSIKIYGTGSILFADNAMQSVKVGISGKCDAIIRNNVVIRGSIGGWKTKSMLIEGNYIHQPEQKGTYCVPGATGILRNNVFRGGGWTLARITGKVIGNVLISLPHDGHDGPGAFDKNCTHEHICGMGPDSVVRRNIFIGASYGGVMGLGKATCSRLEFSNNTLDMKNHGRSVMTNHLPEAPSEKIKVRNNIFMRCTGCRDEAGVKNAISFIDYNLWSEAPTRDARYGKIFIDGLRPGMTGFGKHDVPTTGSIPPSRVVVNAEAKFPFSDEDILSRKHSVKEILAHYREAYTLLPDSKAINAGDPNIADDQVIDAKPDIGAIEYTEAGK